MLAERAGTLEVYSIRKPEMPLSSLIVPPKLSEEPEHPLGMAWEWKHEIL